MHLVVRTGGCQLLAGVEGTAQYRSPVAEFRQSPLLPPLRPPRSGGQHTDTQVSGLSTHESAGALAPNSGPGAGREAPLLAQVAECSALHMLGLCHVAELAALGGFDPCNRIPVNDGWLRWVMGGWLHKREQRRLRRACCV